MTREAAGTGLVTTARCLPAWLSEVLTVRTGRLAVLFVVERFLSIVVYLQRT